MREADRPGNRSLVELLGRLTAATDHPIPYSAPT